MIVDFQNGEIDEINITCTSTFLSRDGLALPLSLFLIDNYLQYFMAFMYAHFCFW
jgi:hypothetical protein